MHGNFAQPTVITGPTADYSSSQQRLNNMHSDNMVSRKNNFVDQNHIENPSGSKNQFTQEDEESKFDMEDEDQFEDMEDEELFNGDNKDLIDNNLKYHRRNEDDEDNNEVMDDVDQSSVEDNDDDNKQEVQSHKIEYPEPPRNFDKRKYQEEFERYDPANVADLMYARKERKIPGSVMKPHQPYVNLVQSNVIKAVTKNVRVLFPYPQYCYRLNTQDSFLIHADQQQMIL